MCVIDTAKITQHCLLFCIPLPTQNWVDWFFPQFLGPLVASGVVVGTSPTTWISALSGVTLSSASLSSIASFLNVEATSAAVTSAMTTLSNTYASLPVNTLEPVTR